MDKCFHNFLGNRNRFCFSWPDSNGNIAYSLHLLIHSIYWHWIRVYDNYPYAHGIYGWFILEFWDGLGGGRDATLPIISATPQQQIPSERVPRKPFQTRKKGSASTHKNPTILFAVEAHKEWERRWWLPVEPNRLLGTWNCVIIRLLIHFLYFPKKQVNSEKLQIDTAPIRLSTSSFDLAFWRISRSTDSRIVARCGWKLKRKKTSILYSSKSFGLAMRMRWPPANANASLPHNVCVVESWNEIFWSSSGLMVCVSMMPRRFIFFCCLS